MKPTDMLYVKTSGEMGMVIRITQFPSDPKPPEGFSSVGVELKIPKATHDNGIVYRIERFYPEELETNLQRLEREETDFLALTTSRKSKASEMIDKVFSGPSLVTN